MEETTQTIETTALQLIENQEVINNLFQSVEQIRTILFFALVVGACTLVIYLILKPLKIIMNGGWI
jgi:hypothetical protein